jgi:alcohol dehydrogenase YqhD (iron-dependent ADH family)
LENFTFDLPTRVIFGKDTQKTVGTELKGTKKVLLHYGSDRIKKTSLFREITESLQSSGIQVVELGGVVPQPALSLVRSGIELCRKENVDFILAVGGGSVIDSAKAIGIGVCYTGDVWDIFTKGIRAEKTIPVGAVLTIPAAGSESSDSCVITNYETKTKQGSSNALYRPKFCIINPELFFTLPKNQIAYGVTDMLSHVFERYFTVSKHTDLIDALAEGVMRTIMKNALLIAKNPNDYDAWCQIGLGGTFAHNNLLGIGRAQAWVCHPLVNKLSATYGVAHGEGLAVVTPAWMKYVYKDNLAFFVQFAVNVMGVSGTFNEPEKIAVEGIDRFAAFLKTIGAPSLWTETPVDVNDLETMAKLLTDVGSGTEKPVAASGFKPLYWQDVLAIYRTSLPSSGGSL